MEVDEEDDRGSDNDKEEGLYGGKEEVAYRGGSFFRLVKEFNTPEKTQTFDVHSLRPGDDDAKIANELADYFNRISAEFEPLRDGQVPKSRQRELDPLAPHEWLPASNALENQSRW